MNTVLIALTAGTIFGLGLAISQMVNPEKVLGFLDVAGDWDPSLMFVMAGALAVAATGFHWARGIGKPVFDNRFHLTGKTQLDRPLLFGAALFGIGWGMTGYCPGPAVTSLALGNREAIVMVASIYAGFWAAGRLKRQR